MGRLTMTSNSIDKKLDQQIAQLPTEMSPQRDLWVGIERAIAQQEQTSPIKASSKKTVHLAWAASFVAAILLTWVTFSPQQPSSSNLALMMEENFNKNKTFILASYGQGKSMPLSGDMEKQLTELSSARKTINDALKADPNNSDLLNLLRWTQQQELDLLQQLYRPQWQTI